MANAFRVLYLGAIKNAQAAVRKHFKDLEESSCESRSEFEALPFKQGELGVQLVIAGPEFVELVTLEIAQGLRMVFQATPVFFVTDRGEGFDRAELTKNGFYDAFLLPADAERFEKALLQVSQEGEHRIYSPVRLVDIQPGTKLDFQISIFLPANNKYLLYSSQGDQIEAARLQRLQAFKQTSVYVPVTQIAAFHSYSASRLLELTSKSSSENDQARKVKLRASIRELLNGMMLGSYSKHIGLGKKVVDHSRQIVRQFIQISGPAEWYRKLFGENQQRVDGYNHADNVGAYASLFAILLQDLYPCRVEELSVAGLYHDLGLALLPSHLQDKPPEKMTADELKLYQQHPILSLEALKTRGLTMSEVVLRAITEHHERSNGSGFPNKRHSDQISLQAHILAIADTFDYLTRAVDTVSPMSPDQAFRQMKLEGTLNSALLDELRLIFEREPKVAS